jgi:hypothetical protein
LRIIYVNQSIIIVDVKNDQPINGREEPLCVNDFTESTGTRRIPAGKSKKLKKQCDIEAYVTFKCNSKLK